MSKVVLHHQENAKKNAQEIQRIIGISFAGHLKQIADIQESTAKLAQTLLPALKPIQDTIARFNHLGVFQDIERMRKLYSELLNPLIFPTKSLTYIPTFPRKNLSEEDVEEIVQDALEKTVEKGILKPLDLLWNQKDKILSRTVPGTTLDSSFRGGDSKRMNLLEKLIKTKKFVQTEDLRDFVGSPNNEAVRKLIQGINDRAKEELNINEKLIEGRPTFGYRINPLISIHQKR